MVKKYTIKDIAKLANVSKGTVDRVLHNRGKVSQKALESVRSVLDRIDYQPNIIAQSLKKNKIFRIALFMPDPATDPFWQPYMHGIKEALSEFNAFNISLENFIYDPEDTQLFHKMAKDLTLSLPDAVLMVPLFMQESHQVIENLSQHQIKIICINNQIHSSLIHGFIGLDLFQSGRVAARLIDSLPGDGDIGIVHIDEEFENASHMQAKEKGFREYFDNRLNSEIKIHSCILQHPDLEFFMKLFLTDHPNMSHIFITTSKSYQVAEVIKKYSKQNVSIVGFDLISENINCLINEQIDFLIHQNPKRQAYLGITQLIEHFIFGKSIKEIHYLPIEIINSENVKYHHN